MAETYSGGITLTWPSAGEVDWVAVYRSFARTISDHDHTGGGRGTKISGSALTVDAFTGASIRLDFNEWLRSRNENNTADVNVLRITTGNELEIGPVVNATTVNVETLNADTLGIAEVVVDKLFVNTSSIVTPYSAIIANTGDAETALQLIAPAGRLNFRLDANAVSGSAITIDYYNENFLVFSQSVSAFGIMSISGDLVPVLDGIRSLGAFDKYFGAVYTNSISAKTLLNTAIGGTTFTRLDDTGDYFPATATQDLGITANPWRTVYTSNVTATTDLNFNTNGALRATIGGSGWFYPAVTSSQDLGTTSNRWRTLWVDSISGPTWSNFSSAPALTSGGGGALTSGTITIHRYLQIGKMVHFYAGGQFTPAGAAVTSLLMTLPGFSLTTIGYLNGFCTAVDNSDNSFALGYWVYSNASTIRIRFFTKNFSSTEGLQDFIISGTVEVT